VEPEKRTPLLRKYLPVVLAIGIPGTCYFLLLKYGYVQIFLVWAASLGLAGNALMICLLIFFAFPWAFGSSVVGMVCGFLYGMSGGFLTLVIGQVTGNLIAFCSIRKFRSYFTELFGSDKKSKFLLHAIEQQPIKFGMLLRYLPIPVGIQTTILALSKIDLLTFGWTSALAEVPLQFMFVSVGSEIGNLSSILSGETGLQLQHIIVLVLEVVGTALVVGLLMYLSRTTQFAQLEENEPV